MSSKREFALVVLGCAAAAAIVLWATGRDWLVEVVPRPAPLSDQVHRQTGGQLRGWLPALGWVALAAAGALLATRGLLRRLTGVLLVLTGAGLALGSASLAVRDQVSPGWPVLASVAGAVVAVAGGLALWRGAGWPTMGARYERGTAPPRPAGAPPGRPGRSEDLWEALERGEDPTASP